jgi:ankyrin repeat protein
MQELYCAVREGNLHQTQNLLKGKDLDTINTVSLNYQGFEDYNALNIAVAMGHLEIVKYLVEQRGVTTTGTPRPLQVATQFGRDKVLAYLISRGDDLFDIQPKSFDAENDGKRSILEAAIVHGRINIVYQVIRQAQRTGHKLIFRNAIVKNRHQNPLITNIMELIRTNKPINLVDIDAEARRNFKYNLQFKMMNALKTCLTENPELISITTCEEYDDNIIHFWVMDRRGIFDWALQNGADGCKYNNKGLKPIHCATSYDFLPIIRMLIKIGEDPNARTLNEEYYTPLMIAARCGYVNLVRFLLDVGADPLLCAANGWSAIHFSARAGIF